MDSLFLLSLNNELHVDSYEKCQKMVTGSKLAVSI